MQDPEDDGMEASRDDHQGEERLSFESGEDGNQDLSSQRNARCPAIQRHTSFGRSYRQRGLTAIVTDERS